MNYIDVAASRELASRLGFSPDDPHCRESIAAQLEAMLDRQFELVTLLDLIEADAEYEPDGDELDTSWTERGPQALRADVTVDEGDEASPDAEDDGTTEPSLGALETNVHSAPLAFWLNQIAHHRHGEATSRFSFEVPLAGHQIGWGDGNRHELEEEHDGREPVNEDGPGWAEHSHDGLLQCGFFGDDDEESDPAGGNITDEPHDGELDLCEGDSGEDMEPDADGDTDDGRPIREEFTRRRRALRRAAMAPGQGRMHGLVLKALPERYAMVCEGDCLSPEIPDGSRLEFSTTQPARPGDFVAIYRWAQFVGAGQWQVVVKRLEWDAREGELSPVTFRKGVAVSVGHGVLADMLNPPARLFYPAEQVEAIHRMVRIIPAEEHQHPRLTPAQVAKHALG